ncbi:glycosyltransferase family 2 protein [Rhodoglobus vestalii]|uniref:glycosyltransferase family 2 protein n=1 Tax=Rhodoglobus vestalii TaxID=193384 RepID=UPI001FE62F40|nr:glycosyltransferase family 2 protein [Rhodoglobus vestalii]
MNYFNARENVLTRMFSLEYGYWFDYMLSGLDSLDLPIPLGGTSNHFRTEALESLGGWDPYNVTEDVDLGIRANALDYRVGVVNSAAESMDHGLYADNVGPRAPTAGVTSRDWFLAI